MVLYRAEHYIYVHLVWSIISRKLVEGPVILVKIIMLRRKSVGDLFLLKENDCSIELINVLCVKC